jgi:hypothetical protein
VATVLLLTRDGRSVPLALQLDCDDHARWLAERLNHAMARLQAPPMPLTYRG